ncbi:MAG: hypothetical protein JSR55_08775 [Proteobacteria bacterium]|nr:hypothetical protein [Pseudomonadota bacterium]
MWRLFYPLTYLSLTNSEKRHIDLWPTLAFALVIALPFILISHSNFFHDGGFLDKLLLLTSALTGFYVAALVAVATFPNADMDKVITVGAITRKVKGADGKPDEEHLTRREFSCAIFGYLAFSALMISVVSVVSVSLSETIDSALRSIPRIGVIFTDSYIAYPRGVLIAIYALAASHLVVVTCLGLYYLTGRVYRRDPQVVTKKAA